MKESSIYSLFNSTFLCPFSGVACYAGLESKDSTKSKELDSSEMTFENSYFPGSVAGMSCTYSLY